MWYFAWILGVGFAACCGVINVLWLENNGRLDEAESINTSQKSS